jgi:hypothetical protein
VIISYRFRLSQYFVCSNSRTAVGVKNKYESRKIIVIEVTPPSRVLIEKLTVTQLIEEFPEFTRSCH